LLINHGVNNLIDLPRQINSHEKPGMAALQDSSIVIKRSKMVDSMDKTEEDTEISVLHHLAIKCGSQSWFCPSRPVKTGQYNLQAWGKTNLCEAA
jgi:hypothetical protein